MFYQRFCQLCDEKGVSRGAACEAVGLSANAWRRWSNGSTPNGKSLKAIAEFFGVDTKDMLRGSDSVDVRQYVLTKIVPRPETGDFTLLYTNGNITSDILPLVHNRLS